MAEVLAASSSYNANQLVVRLMQSCAFARFSCVAAAAMAAAITALLVTTTEYPDLLMSNLQLQCHAALAWLHELWSYISTPPCPFVLLHGIIMVLTATSGMLGCTKSKSSHDHTSSMISTNNIHLIHDPIHISSSRVRHQQHSKNIIESLGGGTGDHRTMISPAMNRHTTSTASYPYTPGAAETVLQDDHTKLSNSSSELQYEPLIVAEQEGGPLLIRSYNCIKATSGDESMVQIDKEMNKLLDADVDAARDDCVGKDREVDYVVKDHVDQYEPPPAVICRHGTGLMINNCSWPQLQLHQVPIGVRRTKSADSESLQINNNRAIPSGLDMTAKQPASNHVVARIRKYCGSGRVSHYRSSNSCISASAATDLHVIRRTASDNYQELDFNISDEALKKRIDDFISRMNAHMRHELVHATASASTVTTASTYTTATSSTPTIPS